MIDVQDSRFGNTMLLHCIQLSNGYEHQITMTGDNYISYVNISLTTQFFLENIF